MQVVDDISLSSPRRTIGRWILAGAGLAALVAIAIVVVKIATASPGAKTCDHLDEIQAEHTIARLERWVSGNVVSMHLTSTSKVEVSGCRDALATLAKVTSFKQFEKLTTCFEQATTDRAAIRCF